MNVLITGARGFIGKNLISALKETKKYKITTFIKGNDTISLENKIKKANFIIHLAGVNRTENRKLFWEVNNDLTKNICDILRENSLKTPILFSSSIQVQLNNEYGKTKLSAENLLKELNESNNNPILIYRLPGIFGKWCKPNYNSVVATFCHNIANNLELKLIDEEKEIRLVYVDDLISNISKNINSNNFGINYIDVNPKYNISISKLALKIKKFKESRENLLIEQIGFGFTKKLYATYLSYLPCEKFSYSLKKYADQRGDFVEILKTIESGQFSYFTAKPGISRGGHYHHTKCEKFLVVEGKAKFRFKNIINEKLFEKITSCENPEIVESIPGWSHEVTNISSDKLIVLVWANEVFDKANPDTFQRKL